MSLAHTLSLLLSLSLSLSLSLHLTQTGDMMLCLLIGGTSQVYFTLIRYNTHGPSLKTIAVDPDG